MRTVGVIGASGFIGGEVAKLASSRGWRVVGFSRSERNSAESVSEWRQWLGQPDLSGMDAVVNLAGEPVDQRWTAAARERFFQSRVGVTRTLVAAMESQPVSILINGSAVGFYGDRGDELLGEESVVGNGYLAELCEAWEAAADTVPSGTRVVKLRIGVVLGSGGAAWKKMRSVFRIGVGGRFGDGKQWMPWVHVEDLAGSIVHLLDSDLAGPVNATAPEPERNADFTRKLASALHRPAMFHAPEWGLKLGLGEFADALLSSQRALPGKLLASGFRFRFPTLDAALADLV